MYHNALTVKLLKFINLKFVLNNIQFLTEEST